MLKYILRPSKQRPSSLGERIKQRNIWATTNGANLLQSEKNNIKNSKAKKKNNQNFHSGRTTSKTHQPREQSSPLLWKKQCQKQLGLENSINPLHSVKTVSQTTRPGKQQPSSSLGGNNVKNTEALKTAVISFTLRRQCLKTQHLD